MVWHAGRAEGGGSKHKSSKDKEKSSKHKHKSSKDRSSKEERSRSDKHDRDRSAKREHRTGSREADPGWAAAVPALADQLQALLHLVFRFPAAVHRMSIYQAAIVLWHRQLAQTQRTLSRPGRSPEAPSHSGTLQIAPASGAGAAQTLKSQQHRQRPASMSPSCSAPGLQRRRRHPPARLQLQLPRTPTGAGLCCICLQAGGRPCLCA